MTLIAEFVVSDPRLPLAETLQSVEAVQIVVHFQPRSPEQDPVILATVQAADFDTLETELGADPSVRDFGLQDSPDDRRTYRIRFEPDVTLLGPALVERGLRIESIESGDGGWAFRVVAPDRETLQKTIDHCRAECERFSLRQLFTASGPSDREEALSETQRETLELAYESGFYEVPRRATQAELAEHLDISTSAVSQRLRKAVHTLIEESLAEEE